MANGSMNNIRFREIVDSDLDKVAAILCKGLGYPKGYFLRLLTRLKLHTTPKGFPKYGYALVCGNSIVGVILLIFSDIQKEGGGSEIRCHVTSWYVEPEYRTYAAFFSSSALKRRDVTYLNTSARPATLPIIKLQGFSKYSSGQFLTIPILHLSPASAENRAEIVSTETITKGRYDSYERDLLLTHERFGNVCFWCSTSESSYPFIFQRRVFKGVLPGAQLVYCREIKDFIRFVQPVGRALAAHGIFFVRVDSNGPISGLVGKYFSGMEPRYFKGVKPRLGDLTYTQSVITQHVRKSPWWRLGS
jgi:hypothetical protein